LRNSILIFIFIVLMIMTGCAETPESIQKKIVKLERERDAIEKEIGEKYLEFAIHGKIIDREKDRIVVWGDSFPTKTFFYPEARTHIGIVRQGNIIVLNPTLKMPDFYSEPGGHYFLKKTTGKNAYGAEVPVRVFTTEIPEGKKELEKKIAKLDKELDNLVNKLREMDTALFKKLYPSIEETGGKDAELKETPTQSTQQEAERSDQIQESEPSLSLQEELLGVKYTLTVENGILYCQVDDTLWNNAPENDKRNFLKLLEQKKYFGKTQFIVKNSKGDHLAEFIGGKIKFHGSSGSSINVYSSDKYMSSRKSSIRDEEYWKSRIENIKSRIKDQERRIAVFKHDLETARRNPREARDSEDSLRNILLEEEQKLDEAKREYENIVQEAKRAGVV